MRQTGSHASAALNPLEIKAGMDLIELKKQYGGRLCLCGNINLDSTLTLGTPEDVDAEVELRIQTIGPGGYCCGSSNSVTEYVPYANYTSRGHILRFLECLET